MWLANDVDYYQSASRFPSAAVVAEVHHPGLGFEIEKTCSRDGGLGFTVKDGVCYLVRKGDGFPF